MAEETPLNGEQAEGPPRNELRIRRASVGSINLYEVTEDELSQLESGSPASTSLNLLVFFISVASSFLVPLLTVPFPDESGVRTVFVVIVAVCYASGAVMIANWIRLRRTTPSVIKRIRERMTITVERTEEA